MSMKSKLIMPTAIATMLVAGAPAQAADSLDGFYAQVRIGIQYQDNGDGAESDATIESFASRIGYNTEKDLGNGLTGFGRLEFQIDAEDSDADPDTGVRDTTKIR
ncbi:MAG: porin, partial [Arenicella sp.]